jgi:hypothetical protein
LSKEVIEKCKSMEVLSMKDCLLNQDKINNIDFDNISSQLKEIDLSKNKDIDNLNFLTNLLTTPRSVSKLALSEMQLNSTILKPIRIGNLCKHLEFLDLSNNCLGDCLDFLNDLFQNTPKLTRLVLRSC